MEEGSKLARKEEKPVINEELTDKIKFSIGFVTMMKEIIGSFLLKIPCWGKVHHIDYRLQGGRSYVALASLSWMLAKFPEFNHYLDSLFSFDWDIVLVSTLPEAE